MYPYISWELNECCQFCSVCVASAQCFGAADVETCITTTKVYKIYFYIVLTNVFVLTFIVSCMSIKIINDVTYST